jgi:transcriptional regulator
MLIPKVFEESRVAVMHELMRQNPLGTLIVMGRTELDAYHVPMEIDPHPTPFGTLSGHLARNNAVYREFQPGTETLVVFTGPDAYVSPGWYATKQAHGKVVPTWNYVAVHARGPLHFIEDSDRVLAHLSSLTARHEAAHAQPWRISDAPKDYIEQQIQHIVMFEIPITQLVGKWKVSQNRTVQDRQGVARGMAALDDRKAVAMAQLVDEADQRGG